MKKKSKAGRLFALVLFALVAQPSTALAAESGASSVTWFLFGGGLFFMVIVVITSAKIVPQGSVGVVEHFGKYIRTEKPGLVILMPLVSSMKVVSMKEQVDEYAPQFVITSDNVTVEVDAVLFFQIVDAARSRYEVQHYHLALEKLTMTALRDIVGEMTLDQCLTSRDRINARLRGALDDATEKWGVKVTRVEIRAIVPPQDIRVAMEKQMKAERDKRASILEAEGARQSAILLAEGEKQAAILRAEGDREASILGAQGRGQAYLELFGSLKECGIDNNMIAVRYLEALEKMANGKATKLLLPIEATAVLSSIAGIAEAARGFTASNGEKIPI
ncbi:MAG: SPFH domain-containing protein [Candidatus Aquicultorales bacterium]